MLVLQDLQRRLGVACTRRAVQYAGHLLLAVSAPLELRHLCDGVQLLQPDILDGQHPCRQRQRVAAETQPRRVVDLLQARLGGLDGSRGERQVMKHAVF